jgi:YVTN family beta-propeller protein
VAGLSLGAAGVASAGGFGAGGFGTAEVGTNNGHGILLPTNQRLTPYGRESVVRTGRMLSSTISPNGKILAGLGWNDFTGYLTLMDLRSGKVVQQVGTGLTPADPAVGDGTVAADGPLYSADGKTLWFPQTADILKFSVLASGKVDPKPTVIPVGTKTMPALPSGMALSGDGSKLYVAFNGSNTLAVIDTATNAVLRQTKVGIGPRQVVVVGGVAYVSNEGGRRPKPGDTTNITNTQVVGSPVTRVVSNPSTGAVNNGTVSVVNLDSGRVVQTIRVGLQPTAMYRRGKALFVANSNDDSFSIIDTATRKVTQTVNVNPLPGSTVGSYPNAITMPDAHHILVSIGRDNALALYGYTSPVAPVQYEGLIPTDFYPVNVAVDHQLGRIVVTNDKGIGARGPVSTIAKGPGTRTATSHNTYDDTSSLTEFAMPGQSAIGGLTHEVFVDDDWEHLLQNASPSAAALEAAQVIPTTLGAPSKIKHVFLIVKENRTYDQVLGDIGKGNSDPALAQFGGSVTPNEHAMADEYGLFDNFYDEGTLSADGHNWLVQADANDYIEKEFGAFYRSYPAQGGDALAYQRDGFLWNAAERAGKTAKAFSEYNNFFTVDTAKPAPTWSQWYADARILQGSQKGALPVPINKYTTYADIPSLNAIDDHAYPRFDLDVPDQYRADIWQKSFAQSVKHDNLANLNLLWVPDDHTSPVGVGDPYPTAEVADNDLAVGRIVSTISHSKYWKSSAIFIVQDDPQNGVDHVDGHRSTLEVVSPYAKRDVIDSTYYTQLNVVRTIEDMLGIAPMNQEDRAAVPMTDAFTDTPDFAPYTVRQNQIPLTFGINGPTAGTTAAAVASTLAGAVAPVVPTTEWSTYQAWAAWGRAQKAAGHLRLEDSINPAQLNRLDFYTATGWTKPYPGDSTILTPNQVPGRNLPSGYLGE